MIGEFRASLDGIRHNPTHILWMTWSYIQLETHHLPGARAQIERIFSGDLFHGVSLLDWLDFARQGVEPLAHLLDLQRHRALDLDVPHPRAAAASFLTAWVWQCALRRHDRYAEADLHVALGLGGDRALAMEWDFRARPLGRHVHIVEASLEQGQFNAHADLHGFPGLPAHCRWPRALHDE